MVKKKIIEHIHTHTHIHTQTYVYIYIHTYIYTYIHTHACTRIRLQNVSKQDLSKEQYITRGMFHVLFCGCPSIQDYGSIGKLH